MSNPIGITEGPPPPKRRVQNGHGISEIRMCADSKPGAWFSRWYPDMSWQKRFQEQGYETAIRVKQTGGYFIYIRRLGGWTV